MKKIVVIFLILSLLFVTSCDFIGNIDGYIEIWSSCDEFDGIGFDFNKYITDLQNDKNVQIELVAEGDSDQEYEVTYSDHSVLSFKVCDDVETAKTAFKELCPIFIGVRSINPFPTVIRVNNIVIYPNDGIISNKRLIHFAKSIGIESDQIILTKINKSSRVVRKDTNKTFESIFQSMEQRGYSLIEKLSSVGENYQLCTFVSNDNSTVYELIMFHGDQAKALLFNRINSSILDFPHDHVHVYYSIGNDFCMYIMGTSADTYDLWNEIR